LQVGIIGFLLAGKGSFFLEYRTGHETTISGDNNNATYLSPFYVCIELFDFLSLV
jgi:hypothetical protein